MADARKDKRTLLSLKIRYKSATLEDFIERYSSDISRGGVFIKAKKPLSVGTLLKFEFLLHDQSSLIHGVGRVVWRREPEESGADRPAGMGIKFVKMDPESRALVQRIVDGRETPGVYEQGQEPEPAEATVVSAPATLATEDRTRVRHVSEFLASAFTEGGVGEEATREAQAGAQRARQISQEIEATRAVPARGALGGRHDLPTAKRQAAPEAVSRSAASAFGRGPASVRPAIAEPFEEFDAEDDFLDDQATRIHDYPEAGTTIVSNGVNGSDLPERRPTPVIAGPSRLESEVPDLFGSDPGVPSPPSGPLESARGELLETGFIESEVPQVPPPAGVPQGPGIPVEAFKLPTERASADPSPYVEDEPSRAAKPEGPRGSGSALPWVIAAVVIIGVAGVGVLRWEALKELAAPYIGDEIEVIDDSPVSPPIEPALPVEAATPAAVEEVAEVVEVVEAEADLDLTGEQLEETEVVEAAVAPEPEAEPVAAVPAGLAEVVVKCRPSRAFVWVDGKPKGRAPITVEVEPGTEISLAARARGFLPKVEQVTVEPGTSTVTLALASLPYYVEVTSDPPGARAVSAGGGETVTPGELRFRSMLSTRSIVFSKDGYETVTKRVHRREFREEPNRMITSILVKLPVDETIKASNTAREPAGENGASDEAGPGQAPIGEATEPRAAPDATGTSADAAP